MLAFHRQNCERKKTWLTIFEADEATTPLRAVPQNHEHELMESLKSSKCQPGVGLLIDANPVSGHFDAVDVDEMLEQQRTSLILKMILRSLSLTVATGACVLKSLRILVRREPNGLYNPFG